jgi:hypothetical protein
MRRICLLLVLLSATGAMAATTTQVKSTLAGTAAPLPASKTAKPSTGTGSDAIDGAVAGVLVGALGEQFGGRAVSILLDRVSVQTSSIRDRTVSGEGRVRIDGDEGWIGFRFSTLYDTSFGSAAYPDITLGGITSDERDIPNDTALVRQLDDNVVARLAKEFANQAVRLQFDHITTVEAGTRYLRINASGIADFGRDGTTPTQIEALYDRRDNTWLRVNYQLGGATDMQDVGVLAGG